MAFPILSDSPGYALVTDLTAINTDADPLEWPVRD